MDARCRRERARLFSFLAHHINSRFLFNDRQDFLPIRGQKSWMYLLIETQHTDNIYEKPNKGVMIFHHVLDVRLFQYMKKQSQISINFLVENREKSLSMTFKLWLKSLINVKPTDMKFLMLKIDNWNKIWAHILHLQCWTVPNICICKKNKFSHFAFPTKSAIILLEGFFLKNKIEILITRRGTIPLSQKINVFKSKIYLWYLHVQGKN